MADKRRATESVPNAYGEVVVERHVYQKAGGGKTYCPMERNARIIMTSTPMFAKHISSKMCYGAGAEVQRDLLDNQGRRIIVVHPEIE